MKNTNKLHFFILFFLIAPGFVSTTIVAQEENDQSELVTKGCNSCGRNCNCCNGTTCTTNCNCGKCCNSCGKSCGCCNKSLQATDCSKQEAESTSAQEVSAV